MHDNCVPQAIFEDYSIAIECATWTPKGQLLVSVGGGGPSTASAKKTSTVLLIDGKQGKVLCSFANALVPENYVTRVENANISVGETKLVVTDLRNSKIVSVLFTRMYMLAVHAVLMPEESME